LLVLRTNSESKTKLKFALFCFKAAFLSGGGGGDEFQTHFSLRNKILPICIGAITKLKTIIKNLAKYLTPSHCEVLKHTGILYIKLTA